MPIGRIAIPDGSAKPIRIGEPALCGQQQTDTGSCRRTVFQRLSVEIAYGLLSGFFIRPCKSCEKPQMKNRLNEDWA